MSASLRNIVDVSVQVSSLSTISSDFNLGLIVGKTLSSSTNTIKIYSYETYQTEMVTDGYATTSPEYKAAVAYFSQNPVSSKLAVGQMITTPTAQTQQLL